MHPGSEYNNYLIWGKVSCKINFKKYIDNAALQSVHQPLESLLCISCIVQELRIEDLNKLIFSFFVKYLFSFQDCHRINPEEDLFASSPSNGVTTTFPILFKVTKKNFDWCWLNEVIDVFEKAWTEEEKGVFHFYVFNLSYNRCGAGEGKKIYESKGNWSEEVLS